MCKNINTYKKIEEYKSIYKRCTYIKNIKRYKSIYKWNIMWNNKLIFLYSA